MPWRVKTFMLVEPDDLKASVYEDREEAEAEADQSMMMQAGEVLCEVIECDEDGTPVK